MGRNSKMKWNENMRIPWSKRSSDDLEFHDDLNLESNNLDNNICLTMRINEMQVLKERF